MIHDPHLWLPAIKAALLGVMLIALVYRFGRTLERRQVEKLRPTMWSSHSNGCGRTLVASSQPADRSAAKTQR